MQTRYFKRSAWMGAGVAAILLISSCETGKKGAFVVNGTFENSGKLAAVAGPVRKVFLLEISLDNRQPALLDSASIPSGNGKFSLRAKTAKPQGIYEVVFGNNALAVPVINDSPLLTLTVDLGKRDDFYDVKGSEATTQLRDFMNEFGRKNYEAEKRGVIADSLHRAGVPDSVQQAAITMGTLAIEDLNTYIRQFINSSPNPTVAAVALTLGSRSFSKSDFDLTLDDLLKKYPDNRVIHELKTGHDQEAQKLAQQQGEVPDWIGKQAPNLSLPDADGRLISLASFRGKYVLVDFWASWCGPCRMENPNVVHAHNEFKSKKNFAILGVSLDKAKNDWQQAIHEDSLDWTQVSDLKYWNSKAVDSFQFQGIPFNVLIDPKGTVIASALRGPELENKLREVLK